MSAVMQLSKAASCLPSVRPARRNVTGCAGPALVPTAPWLLAGCLVHWHWYREAIVLSFGFVRLSVCSRRALAICRCQATCISGARPRLPCYTRLLASASIISAGGASRRSSLVAMAKPNAKLPKRVVNIHCQKCQTRLYKARNVPFCVTGRCSDRWRAICCMFTLASEADGAALIWWCSHMYALYALKCLIVLVYHDYVLQISYDGSPVPLVVQALFPDSHSS